MHRLFRPATIWVASMHLLIAGFSAASQPQIDGFVASGTVSRPNRSGLDVGDSVSLEVYFDSGARGRPGRDGLYWEHRDAQSLFSLTINGASFAPLSRGSIYVRHPDGTGMPGTEGELFFEVDHVEDPYGRPPEEIGIGSPRYVGISMVIPPGYSTVPGEIPWPLPDQSARSLSIGISQQLVPGSNGYSIELAYVDVSTLTVVPEPAHLFFSTALCFLIFNLRHDWLKA